MKGSGLDRGLNAAAAKGWLGVVWCGRRRVRRKAAGWTDWDKGLLGRWTLLTI
jgi:hypothetical protein